jgi:hypothetical protein
VVEIRGTGGIDPNLIRQEKLDPSPCPDGQTCLAGRTDVDCYRLRAEESRPYPAR